MQMLDALLMMYIDLPKRMNPGVKFAHSDFLHNALITIQTRVVQNQDIIKVTYDCTHKEVIHVRRSLVDPICTCTCVCMLFLSLFSYVNFQELCTYEFYMLFLHVAKIQYNTKSKITSSLFTQVFLAASDVIFLYNSEG